MNENIKKENSELVKKIGLRIQQILKDNELKQKDVAHDANLDVENLRKYLKGRQEMRITTFLRILIALNIKAEDLLDDLY